MSDRDAYDEAAEKLLDDLVDVHRGWCNYCQWRKHTCEATKATSYECVVIQAQVAVAAALREGRARQIGLLKEIQEDQAWINKQQEQNIAALKAENDMIEHDRQDRVKREIIYQQIQRERDDLKAECEQLKQDLICDICGGDSEHAAKINCYCKSTGRIWTAFQVARKELFDLRREHRALKAECDRLKIAAQEMPVDEVEEHFRQLEAERDAVFVIVEASRPLVCANDNHTLGCNCSCMVCYQRQAAIDAAKEGKK